MKPNTKTASRLICPFFNHATKPAITINVDDIVSLQGEGSLSSTIRIPTIISTVAGGLSGNGGPINITATSFRVFDGAILTSSTFGQGTAGSINISATNTIFLDGVSSVQSGGIFSTVQPTAIGNGGSISLTTQRLSITNGAVIASNTSGQGDAGDVIVEARDRILIDGIDRRSGRSSGLFTRTESNARGRGGTITIATDSFRISNGAVINAQTFNAFRGGNIIINANTFEATRGGQVITTTTNQGQAGTITLNIRDNLLLRGTDPTFAARQRRFPNAVSNQGSSSGLFANTVLNSRGQGGTIRITTEQLRVEDGARVEVSSLGSGAAGDVRIRAASVRLANEGQLIAETQTVDGGSIFLTNLDQLLLRQQSSISTNAGTTGAGGDGGNIGIDADFIVAVPSENSDITANAVRGNGGRVNVTTQGLFGIAPREFLTPLSDITASSDQGVQGVVAVNTPDVDPSRGLAELPVDVTDATQQIAQNCPSGGSTATELGEFVVTGRGGLPPSPIEVLGSETVLTQLASADNRSEMPVADMPPPVESRIVEAQAWVVNTNGEVMLIAQEPNHSGRSPVFASSCPG